MSRLSILPGRAVTDDRLTPVQFRLLALLCTYTNSEEHSCFPSQGVLADRLSLSRQYVNKILGELETLGYVEKRERRRSDGGITSNLYEVLYDEPDTPPCQQELTPHATARSRQPLSTTGVDNKNVSTERLKEDSSGEGVDEALREYQLIAEQIGLTKVIKLSDKRRTHLKARLSEHGLETWRAAMRAVSESGFLSGRSPQGGRNWRPDFDWFINPTNFLKLIEGKYHDGRPIGADPTLALEETEEEIVHRRRAQSWRMGVWIPAWGPKPGEPGCQIPPHMLPPENRP